MSIPTLEWGTFWWQAGKEMDQGEGKCAKWPELTGGTEQLWRLVFWVKLARLMYPVIWSNASPDVAVKASADVMSITISRLQMKQTSLHSVIISSNKAQPANSEVPWEGQILPQGCANSSFSLLVISDLRAWVYTHIHSHPQMHTHMHTLSPCTHTAHTCIYISHACAHSPSTYTHMHTYAHPQMYTHRYMRTLPLHMHTRVYTHAHILNHTNTCTYSPPHIYTHACAHSYIYRHILTTHCCLCFSGELCQ